MAVTGYRHQDKSKAELMDEIARLKKDLKEKNDEIVLLKKKLSIYKDLK
jgi:hypothetical protein